jgi:hypothetical protein
LRVVTRITTLTVHTDLPPDLPFVAMQASVAPHIGRP